MDALRMDLRYTPRILLEALAWAVDADARQQRRQQREHRRQRRQTAPTTAAPPVTATISETAAAIGPTGRHPE